MLLASFLLASILITVIPGADMALVTRQVLVGGRRLAQRTILGNLTGLLVHGLALALGLSALLVASAAAYTAVKWAGAAYLIYLGVQTIRGAKKPVVEQVEAPKGNAYLAGVVTTVLNPKPALFFLTFLPQFVDPAAPMLPQTLLLTAIHILIGLVWLTFYARIVHSARAVLTAPRVKAWLERTTGVILIGLGLRVALERR
ncbi:MAG: LysE family translocator [Nonomuraea sp.]|nr:LysE family translocator [Nonomuraea sp.]